ncbi:MAG: hypothetical protein V2A66_06960 [Pseudomonadota bacterium]
MTPHELAHELEHIYGEELKSVVLYGSAAGGNHSKKFSDFNVFCVLAKPTPAMLARSNRIVRKWVRRGNPPPHFFGSEHIERSLDVFPIEFLDMMDRHQVLIGHDPLSEFKVDPKNLRHQCESELKGKLLHLRSFYAANCHRPRRMAHMMVESFPSFMAAFRSTLRLAGETPPPEGRAVIEKVAQMAGFNPEIFLEIMAIRGGESVLPRRNDALSAFEQYLTELEAITTFVDKMET